MPSRPDQPASPLTYPAPESLKTSNAAEASEHTSPAPPPWPTDTAAARRRIELLEASANPRFFSELATYLSHPDPLLRRRALNALLLGADESAIPPVRAAEARARQLGEADWAAELSRAAEFLAQPWTPETKPQPKTLAEVEEEWQREGSPEERKRAKAVDPAPAERLIE